MKSSGLNEDKTQSQSSALRQTSKGRELRIYNKKLEILDRASRCNSIFLKLDLGFKQLL